MGRHFSVISAVALLTLFLAVEVQAQPGRGGFGRGGMMGGAQEVSEVNLVVMPEVVKHLQEEYGLDEEKAKEIQSIADAAMQEMQEERRALMGDFRNMSDEERQSAMEELREVSREILDDARNSIKKLLSEKQLERLQQLKLQRLGVRALEDGLIQDMLAFTDEQVAKVKEAIEAANEKRQAWMAEMREQFQSGAGGFDRDAIREKMQAMQEEFENAMMSILTDQQKKQLEELKGKIFEFPERGFGRRGR